MTRLGECQEGVVFYNVCAKKISMETVKNVTAKTIGNLPPYISEIHLWFEQYDELGDLDDDYSGKERIIIKRDYPTWKLGKYSVTDSDVANFIKKTNKEWQSADKQNFLTVWCVNPKTDDYVLLEEANTLKGFKTATYGKKPRRDNILQLENSVRKMF